MSLFLLLLSACGSPVNEETASEDTQTGTPEMVETNENIVSRNQLGEEYYNFVLDEDGNYATSQNRGITSNLNSGINISVFEKDLLRLSQEQFPTNQYYIMEGQKLESNLVESWLRRRNPEAEEDDPLYEGLNPEAAADGAERTPRYLNSILELDFYSQTDNGMQFKGISIGLAMNTVDMYQEAIGDPVLNQRIAPEIALAQGQEMADKIVSRIRQMEGLEELPVLIGIYEQSAPDNLAGGKYVALGVSTNGSSAIQNWESLNEERLVFPLEGSASAEGNAFANFQSEVEMFFPNISGVTGRAHYINNTLDSLKIDIMTQFYGETEMISFTQYLKQSAATFLPADIDIEIVVQSSSGIESFLKKDRVDSEYFFYVFD